MNTKKMTASVIAATILMAGLFGTTSASAADIQMKRTDLPIQILYDARQLATDVPPENVSGSVVVPIRFISDKMGAKITLSGKKISVTKGAKKLDLSIGASTATVSGKSVKLNVPVRVTKGRTLVPLRVISEGLGLPVEWDSVNQFVWVGNKEVPKLEDAIMPVDMKPYAHYFANDPYFLKDLLSEGKPFTKARIITQQDFPLIISGDIYYRMDLARDPKGKTYTRASTTDKGIMGRTFLFLQTGERVKFRSETPFYRESIGTDIRIHYNPVVAKDDYNRLKINNYESLSIKSIEYIDIRADSDSKILFKNPWR